MEKAPTTSHSPNGVVCLDSAHAFAETVQRIISTLADHGIKVFATIDQQAEALAAGLTMPPMTLILFGNPKSGTPLMVAQPESGIDLPLKALVAEAVPGRVTVSFNSAEYIVTRHALPAAMSANLLPAERLLADALIASSNR